MMGNLTFQPSAPGQRALSPGTKPAFNLMSFQWKPFALGSGVITAEQPYYVIKLGGHCPGGWPLLPCSGRPGPGRPLFFPHCSSPCFPPPQPLSRACQGEAQGRSAGLGAQDLGSNEVCDIWEQ